MIRSIRVIRVLLMRSLHDSKSIDDQRWRTNRITKLTCGWIASRLPLQPKLPQQTSSSTAGIHIFSASSY
jgi:hypothetical protein